MNIVLEMVVATMLVIGMLFALIGSWGLAKLGDFYKRLHGPSKATTLGVGCVLMASWLWSASLGHGSGHEWLVLVFLFVTAPVSAHLLVQAALALLPGSQPTPPLPDPKDLPPGPV